MFHFSSHCLTLSSIQSHHLPFIFIFLSSSTLTNPSPIPPSPMPNSWSSPLPSSDSSLPPLAVDPSPKPLPFSSPFHFFFFLPPLLADPTPLPKWQPISSSTHCQPKPQAIANSSLPPLIVSIGCCGSNMGCVDVDRVVVMGCCSVGCVVDHWSGLCGWVGGSLGVCGWLNVSLGEGFGSLGYDVVVVGL